MLISLAALNVWLSVQDGLTSSNLPAIKLWYLQKKMIGKKLTPSRRLIPAGEHVNYHLWNLLLMIETYYCCHLLNYFSNLILALVNMTKTILTTYREYSIVNCFCCQCTISISSSGWFLNITINWWHVQ